jgi:hypothetical protein
VLRFRISQDGLTRGYFPALLIRKGPFRILGSPLPGGWSEYQGPVGDPDLPVEPFLEALDRLCRTRRIHQLELGSPRFEPAEMSRRGYQVMQWRTLRVPLSREPEPMWTALSGKARNRIRRAQGLGLVAESSGPGFVERHFRHVAEVFGRQGLRPPIALQDCRALFDRLSSRDELFALEIRHPETGESLASGMFPHDGSTVYSLTSGSSARGREWSANELLHWRVMILAGERGLADYRMGDNYRTPVAGGGFKDKFGGVPEPVFRYVRHYSALARYARSVFVTLRRLTRYQPWRRRPAA